MDSSPPPSQYPTPPESTHRSQSGTMGGAYRTPSPNLEAHISSAEHTPHTPVGPHSGFFGTGTFPEEQHGTPVESIAPLLATTLHPQTPTLKRVKMNWHGLPSPQTPSDESRFVKEQSENHASDAVRDRDDKETDDIWTNGSMERSTKPFSSPITPRYSSVSGPTKVADSPNYDELTPSTSTDGDAELALQLSSPSSVRRSTRLRDKLKPRGADKSQATAKTGKPVIKALSPTPQPQSPPALTQAEPTKSPFEVAVASNIELPALYSAEWQLMYPPGGSTHPCYPWPVADPRLAFQPHHVPLNNGLPDVSYLPALTLPTGWRQASWSGLHPIVFDPSQQGFKLTPVGPLPLTCEEVHQGGLQDYVPGGRLHPEYGMLPVLSSLSDGSDAEVYNFEGVDWKLPWAQIEGGLEVESTAPMSSLTADSGAPAILDALAVSVVETRPHYIENRDCPDDVTDLEDAWRWLKEYDPNCSTPFTATPGKTWFRSGIPLTSKTTKQPIASLMALNMADKTPSVEHWLVKQVRREFCPFKSLATPVQIDITLLRYVEFTIVELLSYFPFHYQWRGAANRLARCGMGSSDVANLINMVRRLPAGSLCVASTVNGHLRWDRDEHGNKIRVEPLPNDATCYTAEHWSNNVWEKTDYPLLGLAIGLKELPSDGDAGPLTAIIKWCRDNGRYQTMLSEVPNLLKEANVESLIDPGNGTDPDKDVLARHFEALKADRKRVIQEQKSKKRKSE